ncbi:MAG: site-specific DNA-methyltransferase [Desulfomonilaceae bacterium]
MQDNQTCTDKTSTSEVRPNKDKGLTFYGRRICQHFEGVENIPYEENPIPADRIDRIFCKSSESMDELPDCSVHFMVTSPPYNCGKPYDLDLDLTEYLQFLKRVLVETYRVLIPGGRMAINIAGLGRRPYIALQAHVMMLSIDIGFLPRGGIIWVKAKGKSGSCAWGSWRSASNPTLRDLHEYVLLFSKARFDRAQKGNSTIGRDEFLEATTSLWYIPPESPRRVKHPAPFPEALVERLINLYTFEGDIVLDAFIGSGTTAVAALKNSRHFIGYETCPEYVALAEARLTSLSLPERNSRGAVSA